MAAAKQLIALILLLVATAAVARTSYRADRCETEVEQQMPMRRCMMWAQSRMRGPYNYYGEEEEEKQLQECCSELEMVSSECRCRAVKEMMTEMPRMEMRRMMCSLPTKCGMRSCGCPRSAFV